MAGKKKSNMKQTPFRLHENDHRMFKSKCVIDGIKMQTLIEACIQAYLDGDRHVKMLALEFKSLNTVSKKRTSWSKREQERMLDEIEGFGDD